MEWISEPNFFTDSYNDIRYFIMRNEYCGFLCGYVEIASLHKEIANYMDYIVCHGGLTFNGLLKDGEKVIGFDCGHYGDFQPYSKFIDSKSEYRNLNFCINECVNIIDQISIFKNKYVMFLNNSDFDKWCHKNKFIVFNNGHTNIVATNNEDDYLLLKMTW
jgi:hypothetical protein